MNKAALQSECMSERKHLNTKPLQSCGSRIAINIKESQCRTRHLQATVNEPLREGTGPDSNLHEESCNRFA